MSNDSNREIHEKLKKLGFDLAVNHDSEENVQRMRARAAKRNIEPLEEIEEMSDEEADAITQEEIKEGNIPANFFEDEFQELSEAFASNADKAKSLCSKFINQFPTGSKPWRKAKSICKNNFGHIREVSDHIDTFIYKKTSEISPWLNEINNECNKKLTKLLTVLNYMLTHAEKRDAGRKLTHIKIEAPYKLKKTDEYKAGLFEPVIFFKEKKDILADLANNGLKIKQRQLDKYIRWLVQEEIILNVGRKGSHGQNIYAVGYWFDINKDGGTLSNPLPLYRMKSKRDQFEYAFRNFSL